MPVDVKICGLKTEAAVTAAVEGGAFMVGFVFFARSPRCVTPDEARMLGALVPPTVSKVGLVVDATDDFIAGILAAARLDILQLHGGESPGRVAEIRSRFALPVMKAVSVAGATDIAASRAYETVADRLLFDARPPESLPGALPGGNALAFDWRLLSGQRFGLPWMLAGGLHAGNLAEAVRLTGARAIDTSSGVEDRPGEKNINKIKELLALARTI